MPLRSVWLTWATVLIVLSCDSKSPAAPIELLRARPTAPIAPPTPTAMAAVVLEMPAWARWSEPVVLPTEASSFDRPRWALPILGEKSSLRVSRAASWACSANAT
jgi:hypothetical protein